MYVTKDQNQKEQTRKRSQKLKKERTIQSHQSRTDALPHPALALPRAVAKRQRVMIPRILRGQWLWVVDVRRRIMTMAVARRVRMMRLRMRMRMREMRLLLMVLLVLMLLAMIVPPDKPLVLDRRQDRRRRLEPPCARSRIACTRGAAGGALQA